MKRYTVLLIVLGMLAGLIPQSVYAAESILVEAESFTGYLDASGVGIEYTNGSTKNALVIREGEYSEYTVNVRYAGTYKLVALQLCSRKQHSEDRTDFTERFKSVFL